MIVMMAGTNIRALTQDPSCCNCDAGEVASSKASVHQFVGVSYKCGASWESSPDVPAKLGAQIVTSILHSGILGTTNGW